MTVRRQQRKEFRAALRLVFAALMLAPGALSAQSLTDRIVSNRFTGLAISGYDPVAYFTEARSVRGVEQYEAMQGGVVWRFRNEGNRAAFLGHPGVYSPQFGGHDPVDVARGRTVAGSPEVWILHHGRLFLFASETSRQAFTANPDGFQSLAEKRWPALREDLAN